MRDEAIAVVCGAVSRHRPFGVTVLVFLVWLQALLQIAGGVILIFVRDDGDVLSQTSLSGDELLALAIGLIIVGLITALVASALGHGSNFARWLVAILTLLNLGGAIYQLTSVNADSEISAIASIVIALLVLYVLFAERGSREFFTGR